MERRFSDFIHPSQDQSTSDPSQVPDKSDDHTESELEREKTSVSAGNKVSAWLVMGLAFLLPLVFVPMQFVSLGSGKITFITIIVVALTIIWVYKLIQQRSKYKNRSFKFSFIFLSLVALATVYLASALTATSFKVSFFGQDGTTDTVFFILLMALLCTLTARLIYDREVILNTLLAVLISAAFLGIWLTAQAIINLAGVDVSITPFNSSFFSSVGQPVAVTTFFGGIAVVSLVGTTLFKHNLRARAIFAGLLALTIPFISLIDFTPVWIILSLLALPPIIVWLVKLFRDRSNRLAKFDLGATADHAVEEETDRLSYLKLIPIESIAVLVLGVVFIITGGFLSGEVSDAFGVTTVSVVPSPESTMSVAQGTLEDELLLGSGPNTFDIQWQEFKPLAINSTQFFDSHFSAGFSTLTTVATTVGILGTASWLLFIVWFLYLGVSRMRNLRSSGSIKQFTYLGVFSFSAYWWILSFVTVLNVSFMALAFLFSGLFLSLLAQQGELANFNINFNSGLTQKLKPALSMGVVSFGAMIVVILVLIAAQLQAGSLFFARGQQALARDDISTAQTQIERALDIHETDNYYRAQALVRFMELQQFLGGLGENAEDDLGGIVNMQAEEEEHIRSLISSALASAHNAVRYDSRNYRNWNTLGQTYTQVGMLGVEGAFEQAVNAFQEASERSPNNPGLYLALAQVAQAQGEMIQAQDLVEQALDIRPEYTPAQELLSELTS